MTKKTPSTSKKTGTNSFTLQMRPSAPVTLSSASVSSSSSAPRSQQRRGNSKPSQHEQSESEEELPKKSSTSRKRKSKPTVVVLQANAESEKKTTQKESELRNLTRFRGAIRFGLENENGGMHRIARAVVESVSTLVPFLETKKLPWLDGYFATHPERLPSELCVDTCSACKHEDMIVRKGCGCALTTCIKCHVSKRTCTQEDGELSDSSNSSNDDDVDVVLEKNDEEVDEDTPPLKKARLVQSSDVEEEDAHDGILLDFVPDDDIYIMDCVPGEDVSTGKTQEEETTEGAQILLGEPADHSTDVAVTPCVQSSSGSVQESLTRKEVVEIVNSALEAKFAEWMQKYNMKAKEDIPVSTTYVPSTPLRLPQQPSKNSARRNVTQ